MLSVGPFQRGIFLSMVTHNARKLNKLDTVASGASEGTAGVSPPTPMRSEASVA